MAIWNNNRKKFSATRESVLSVDHLSIWKAILAIEDYPLWQRAILDTKVLKRDPSAQPTEALLVVNALIRAVQFTLVYKYDDPPHRLSWKTTTGGDAGKIFGWYELFAVPSDANKTNVRFHLEVQPGVPIPKHVRNVLEKTAFEQVLVDLERHAQSIAAKA